MNWLDYVVLVVFAMFLGYCVRVFHRTKGRRK